MIRAFAWKRPSPLPGFGFTMSLTLIYLALVVLIPLAALVWRAGALGLPGVAHIALDARVLAALRVTLGVALAAALVDVVFGVLIAWALTRYRFPGRRVFDAIVDLPFALPTAVAGISLATLYAPNGLFGAALEKLALRVAFTPWGILVALVFVGLPFVVRAVQPVLEELELEEASATLGASRAKTLRRIILPQIAAAALTGMALAFARGVGEYGSVIFIAGNIAYVPRSRRCSSSSSLRNTTTTARPQSPRSCLRSRASTTISLMGSPCARAVNARPAPQSRRASASCSR